VVIASADVKHDLLVDAVCIKQLNTSEAPRNAALPEIIADHDTISEGQHACPP
jgi:hypothetical protein